jgi:hypothetical protein
VVIRTWLSVLMYVAVASCGAPAQVSEAAYCAAAHTQGEEDERRLLALVADFALEQGLEQLGYYPGAIDFTSEASDLSLGFRMGSHGTVVSVFEFGADTGLGVELDAYLMERVDPIFPVKHCSDIPGFDPPRMIGRPS